MRHLREIAGIMLVFQFISQPAAGNDLLLNASRQSDISTLKSLLDKGVDVNSARGDGVTALTEAIFYQADHKVIDFLIGAGADVNARDDYGVSLLHLACANHDAVVLQKLLAKGADARHAKITGETPLMTCANSGSVDGVKALLANGADVNASEHKEGQTALMWASAEGHDDIVRALVEAGGDINARSKAITLLKPYVIDFDLDLSIWGSNYPSTVRWPKVSGAFTALHFAARNGHLETTRVLLEAGADINLPHPELGNALLIATASGHEELAVYLLKNGANPNVRDTWGITPLHYALHRGLLNLNGVQPVEAKSADWERDDMTKLVEVLLDYGADPDARIEYEYPYLEYTFLARGDSLPAQISPVGATPLLLAAASGNLEAMYMLEEVSDTSITTVGGANLFMLAAGAGAEMDIRQEDEALEAAKHVLSEVGNVDINAFLTDIIPGGPARDRADGRTALHFAALYGWPKMIRFLVENGADVDVEDRYGVTPLMLALGDPEGRLAQNVGEFNNDHRFRRPGGARQSSGEGNNELANLLLELGATPCECKPMDLTGR